MGSPFGPTNETQFQTQRREAIILAARLHSALRTLGEFTVSRDASVVSMGGIVTDLTEACEKAHAILLRIKDGAPNGVGGTK